MTKYIKTNFFLFLLILVGFFFQMLIIVPSGTYLCFGQRCGIQFWGAHQHDMVWHLALAVVAFNQWPFVSPVFAGAGLAGYNFLLDWFAYLFTRLKLPAVLVYFKLLPVIWFGLFTGSVIYLFKKINKSKLELMIFLFFSYFGGSFGFIFSLWHQRSIWGGSAMLAMQALLSLTNLQYVFSLIILIWILIIGIDKKIDWRRGLLISGLVAVSFGLKFYSGIISLLLVGLLFLFNWQGWVRTIINTGITILAVGAAVIFFYNPGTAVKTGLPLIFSPFAISHSIIEDSTLFYLPKIANMRYILYQSGWGPRLVAIELLTLIIFLIFNFGSRFFGLIYFGYRLLRKEATRFDWIILLTAAGAVSLSVLFVQKGIWWNTVQFIYYGLFFGNFLIAELINKLFRSRRLGLILLAAGLILINLPENLDVLRGFNPVRPSSYIPEYELQALEFLRKQPKGIIYTPYFNPDIQKKIRHQYREPYPLYAVVDSAYIQAFAHKQAFFNDLHILSITGVDYRPREKLIQAGSCRVLEQIDYLYLIKQYPDPVVLSCSQVIKKQFKNIFTNSLVEIYTHSR